MRNANYWETEEPETLNTGRNVLRHFPEAERLQVSTPDFVGRDGQTHTGKTVGIDLEPIHEKIAAGGDEAQAVVDFFAHVVGIEQEAKEE